MLRVVSPVAVTWLVIGLVTLGIMAVVLVGLFRQLKRLAGSVSAFSREIQPVLSELQREAETARQRVESAGEKAEQLKDRGRGGRRRG